MFQELIDHVPIHLRQGKIHDSVRVGRGTLAEDLQTDQ